MNTKSIKAFLSVVALSLASFSANAQSGLAGSWNGVLTFAGNELTVVLHIDPAGSTMDSPDQGAYDIPAVLKELTDAKVNIEVPSVGASFEANLMFGLLVGKFKQSGIEIPLSLKPGDLERKRPQTPQGPFPYASEEVSFTNPQDGAVLSGTLVCPQNHDRNTPVVLFVSGSGLQNRDEEVYSHKTFHVIADHLARNGIASLRYDDRSVGKSTGNAADATTDTFMQDAAAGIGFLRSADRFGKVGVIGHSEGGTIAFMLAGDRKVDFIVSMAGTSLNGVRILVEQNKAIMLKSAVPERITNDYCNVLQKLYAYRIVEYLNGKTEVEDPEKTVEMIVSMAGAELPEGLKANLTQIISSHNPWLMRFMILDPAEWIKKIACPVMAINGEKDVQVIAEQNLSMLKEILPASDTHMIKAYPDLNHMFQHCTTGMPDEYGKIEETISPEVLEDITSWINSLNR